MAMTANQIIEGLRILAHANGVPVDALEVIVCYDRELLVDGPPPEKLIPEFKELLASLGWIYTANHTCWEFYA